MRFESGRKMRHNLLHSDALASQDTGFAPGLECFGGRIDSLGEFMIGGERHAGE